MFALAIASTFVRPRLESPALCVQRACRLRIAQCAICATRMRFVQTVTAEICRELVIFKPKICPKTVRKQARTAIDRERRANRAHAFHGQFCRIHNTLLLEPDACPICSKTATESSVSKQAWQCAAEWRANSHLVHDDRHRQLLLLRHLQADVERLAIAQAPRTIKSPRCYN